MNRKLLFVSLVAVSFAPVAAWAGPPAVAYARASSQLKLDTKPSLFLPLNMLDGNPKTVWCEGADGDGVGESVNVGFKGHLDVDEIRITTGDARDAASFKAHGRAKQLDLKTDEKRYSFSVVDNTTPQSFKFDSFNVDRLTVEIAEVVPGEGEEKSVACIADVLFLSKGKVVNGAIMDGKFGYDKGRAALMGAWYGGPSGARDKFLDFNYDGTYWYSFKPFDPEIKAEAFGGRYTFDGERLRFELPSKKWVEVRTEPRANSEGTAVLEVESKPGIEKTLADKWNDRP